MERKFTLTTLLLLTVITVAKGQYFDIVQGLQQFFQPYPANDFVAQYNGVTRNPNSHRQTNRQENRKKTNEQRNQSQDSRTKKPTLNQYDYIFPTTQKPSRKTTKHVSSQSISNIRNVFNKNTQSNLLIGDYYNNYDVTTKSNRLTTTTTEVNYYNDFNNRATTENVFKNSNVYKNINNKPVTENVFENDNRKDNYAVNYESNNQNNRRLSNNGSGNDYNNNNDQNTNNRDFINNQNNGRGILNTDYNNEVPKNTRNPNVFGINPDGNIRGNNNNRNTNNNGFLNTDVNPDLPNNFGNTGLGNRGRPNNRVNPNNYDSNNFGTEANINRGISNNFNNGATSNNRGSSNNFDPNQGVNFNYPTDNPLINRPGVKPAPVDVNQPPITNKPLGSGNNFLVFNRPTDSGSITFTDGPDTQPEILIGPDEDEMTDRQKRRYLDLAERTCDRYKALTVKKVVALPLVPSPNPVELNVSDCTPINVPLVIGGKVVSIQEFPHMALVGWMKTRTAGYSWKCGGSLISDQFVLTAGHCTYQDKDYDVVSGPPQAVQLGSSYLDDPGAVVVKIAAVIRHPKYKMRRSYHDVALIKMVSKVSFSEVIRPACLGVPPPEGQSIIATGWGRTEFGGDHSEELRSVSLPVWNMEECREIWGTSLKLPNGVTPDSHVCAGEKRGGKDTCQGDSGGPAQVRSGCAWRVVGVTSLGRSCGAARTPALYALVPRALVAAVALDPRSLYS